ncbi:DUF503 family protein [Patescibacteria group bacterium]|nr:DUF503 family protein [Patescibacteria group bacterium]
MRLFSSNSLKDKLKICHFCRIRKHFNVSISEIEYQKLSVKYSFLTTQTKFSYQVMNKIIDFLQQEKTF